MTQSSPRATRRTDYRPPRFLVDHVDLRFELDPASTLVRSRLSMRRNPALAGPEADGPLRLDGDGLTLLGLRLDGTPLPQAAYTIAEDGALLVHAVPDAFLLETEVRIAPETNTQLSGLYTSGGNFYT